MKKFSKTEDQSSQAMKQTSKGAFWNNMHHRYTMKKIAKAYLNNRECSVREADHESNLKRIFQIQHPTKQ